MPIHTNDTYKQPTIDSILDHCNDGEDVKYYVKYSNNDLKWVNANKLCNYQRLLRYYQRNKDYVYKSINTKSSNKDRVYKSINTKSSDKDRVYKSINTKSSDKDRVYKSINTKSSKNLLSESLDKVIIPDTISFLKITSDNVPTVPLKKVFKRKINDTELCDPFANISDQRSNSCHNNIPTNCPDKKDDHVIPRCKKAKYHDGDEVVEIENILETKKVDGDDNYLIKWVGTKKPTWIKQNDFYDHELLDEFWKYKTIRENDTISRKAYIYCRTSRRNGEREVSLCDQEYHCIDFAKKNNISIIGIYRDNGVSAKNMQNQFALNYICDKIKRGECILFYDVSRFSRTMIPALQRLEHLQANIGAIVHSCHDGLTWNNVASNRACFRTNLSNAQLHSDVISEKVISAIEYKRERGDHIGYVPYGYMTQLVSGIRKLVPDNKERDVIRAILDSAHQSNAGINEFAPVHYKKIAAEVNILHHNRRNKPFTWRFIKGIIVKWSDDKTI